MTEAKAVPTNDSIGSGGWGQKRDIKPDIERENALQTMPRLKRLRRVLRHTLWFKRNQDQGEEIS